MSTKSIKTTLSYSLQNKFNQQWFFEYDRSSKEMAQSSFPTKYQGNPISIEKDIHNARLISKDANGNDFPQLDVHGFSLISHPTKLSKSDFYKLNDKRRELYYNEIVDAIKQETNSPYVFCYHHQVRNVGKVKKDSTVTGYAFGIHCDLNSVSARNHFQEYIDSGKLGSQPRGQFMFVNAWRNISDTPIVNDSLAVCDENSIIKPDDYITQIYFSDQKHQLQQYVLDATNSDQHLWYYYPNMTKDEILLFKTWDSDYRKSSRCCFHTAFKDPTAPSDAPKRESIEVRCVVFFPDQEKDACSTIRMVGNSSRNETFLQNEDTILQLLKDVPDADTVAHAAATIYSSLEMIDVWPSGKLYAKSAFSGSKRKLVTFLKHLIKNRDGSYEIADLTAEQQELTLQVLLVKLTKQRIDEIYAKIDVPKGWSSKMKAGVVDSLMYLS